MTYNEFKETYKWTIKNNPDVTALYGITKKCITRIETRYIRHGKKWVEVETTTENVTPEYYLNTIDAVPFFRNLGGYERLIKNYTKYGFIPVEVHSTRPDGMEKVTRTFKF